tara:strand:- start:557 stop:718 length:162 start_codon:yes stop_codon:yes gene_type:complete
MSSLLFRDLNDQEVVEFQQWARDNYVIGSPINIVWHPVVVAECNQMNAESDEK